MYVYELRVSLVGITPLIWRRLLVPSDISLPTLHECIQHAVGWANSHQHRFRVDRLSYGVPDPEWPESVMLDERRVRLCDLLDDERREMTYEYDFGDVWEHQIVLEEVVMPSEFLRYPLCVAGERACPPEDVGGAAGYTEFLEIIGDVESYGFEYLESLLWAGGGVFDPEGFDINTVNRALGRVRL